MPNGFFVITGTSRGIGEALAKTLLEKGNAVLGIARSMSEKLDVDHYHHLSADLSDVSSVDSIMNAINRIVDGQDFDFICLVHNASALEPIGKIEKCPAPEIETHVNIGLLTPMILTSKFIARFANDTMRKKIAFMSSGAAERPLQDEGVYCTTKAGLLMFANTVALEQKERASGFEVVSISPGMVETTMQKTLRSKTKDEFAIVEMFKQAYEAGQVQEPESVAEKIVTALHNTYEQGQLVRVNEL